MRTKDKKRRMNTFPKTVYRTPNPEFQVSEAYEISIEPVPNCPNSERCWIVRELHGYYHEPSGQFRHQVDTLHPTDPKHFLTLDEAQKIADKQVLFRARYGFHFLFTRNYSDPPWYERFEVVLPAGEIKPLP
jgi:hypothetical protein